MILIPEPINGDSSIRYNQYSKLFLRQITEIVWFWYWECAHNSGSFWCGLPMRIVTFLLIVLQKGVYVSFRAREGVPRGLLFRIRRLGFLIVTVTGVVVTLWDELLGVLNFRLEGLWLIFVLNFLEVSCSCRLYTEKKRLEENPRRLQKTKISLFFCLGFSWSLFFSV